MSVVVIGPEEMKLIEQAVAKARANPIPLETLAALQHDIPDKSVLRLEDRKQPFKRPESQHVTFPGGFRASISFEQQPAGLVRHLSISSPTPGRVPNLPAVTMIAEAFGFWLPPEKMWLEEFEPGHYALNLLELVEKPKAWDIPHDKSYPPDAVQCDQCGGWGCEVCEGNGWLPAGHARGRKCHRDGCDNPIPPSQVAVYCSNECAIKDA